MNNPVVIPPTVEPLYAAEALEYLGASEEDEALVDMLVRTARQMVEQMTGRALAVQTRELVIDAFPCGRALPLPGAPLVSVESVRYFDASGAEVTMSADDYVVDAEGLPGSIYAKRGWPCTDGRPGGVKVRYTCGYESAVDVPMPLLLGMRYLVNHWFDNRNPVLIGSISKSLEFTLDSLVSPYRVYYRLPELRS